MKKYFLIESIWRDQQPGDQDGWTKYTIMPVIKGLQSLPKMVFEYNEGQRKIVYLEVYGVKGQETAVIELSGPRKRVKGFPSALAATNFYEYFSLREVEFPDIYL
jgi:hypothetical protein